MRRVIVTLMILAIAATAIAQDLGNSRQLPAKDTAIITYSPPAAVRTGGDTFFDATVIPGLPYSDTGNTANFMDDYDEACTYTGSTSPDVVYSFTPAGDIDIYVDLCGSSYDTKTYIYDSSLNLIACNDDFYFTDDCGTYVSKIEDAPLLGGETYYIIVDGYGGASGDYILNIDELVPCVMDDCPADAVAEGEPHLGDGYADAWNGGCNSPEFGNPFQLINWTNDEDGVPPYDGYAWLCGKSGWYHAADGTETRDTDWFKAIALDDGMMDFTVEAEYETYIFKLSPTDCGTAAVELEATANCGMPATLSFPVTAGEEVWLWVGPTTFTGPVTEYTYFMTLSNNTFDIVPNENRSWGEVKALYR